MNRSVRVPVVLALALFLFGCSKTDPHRQLQSSILQPVPTDQASIAAQSARYRGQTKFLNYRLRFNVRAAAMEKGMGAAPDAGGARREIEESDVFKVEGKLLYLLNNYRGIQVVSYEDPNKPKLVARVKAKGNSPEDMFYKKENKRLYVVENNYYDSDDSYYSDQKSRILVYKAFPDGNKPQLLQTVDIDGYLQDTRRVGEVLYVATQKYNWYGNNKTAGFIRSYKLEDKEVTEGQSMKFSYPLKSTWRGQEPINFVEVPVGKDKYSYYAVAQLSDSPYWWSDRNNVIEVLDITSNEGAIKHVMFATAKGTTSLRSATLIKDNNLIVASDYDALSGKKRVAVEAFKLPAKGTKGLSPAQGELRQAYLKAKLEEAASPEDKVKVEKEIGDSKEWSLRGQFIRTEGNDDQGEKEVRLKKVVPDLIATSGSDEGESTAIQSVTLLNGRLAVLWVPASKIDPIDIFDLKDANKAVTHLGQTKFTGWGEASRVVAYKGKEYIFVLGRQIPVADNETGKRVAQALVFEVPEDLEENDGEAKLVARQVLNGSENEWMNFRGPDKDIQFAFDANTGKGSALFQYQSWAKDQYGSGGKVVGFDLNKPKKEVISQADYFVKGGDWLKRAFTFQSLVNLFSDKSLVTFKQDQANATAEVLSRLELARDIREYVSLGNSGVQIISDYSYADENNPNQLTLRLVDAKKPDAEVDQLQGPELKLSMPYSQSLVSADGGLYLLGTQYKSKKDGDKRKSWQEVTVARVAVEGDKLVLQGTSTWENEPAKFADDDFGGDIMPLRSSIIGRPFFQRQVPAELVQLPGGSVVVNNGTAIRLLTLNSGKLNARVANRAECLKSLDKKDDLALRLQVISGALYATFEEKVATGDEDKQGAGRWGSTLSYVRNYLTKANVKDDVLSCTKAVNIPGTPVAILGKRLVSNDQHLADIAKFKTEIEEDGKQKLQEYQAQLTENVVSAVAIDFDEKAVATLTDVYDPTGSNSPMKQAGDKFVLLEGSDRSEPALSVLSFDKDGQFVKQPYLIDIARENIRPTELVSIFENRAKKGGYLAVALQGRRGVVLGWDEANPRPVVKEVAVVDENFKQEEPEKVFTLLQTWYFRYSGGTSVNYTASQQSLEFPLGLYGVQQIFVKD